MARKHGATRWCWSHLRRRVVKLARNSKSPIAEAAVRQIGCVDVFVIACLI